MLAPLPATRWLSSDLDGRFGRTAAASPEIELMERCPRHQLQSGLIDELQLPIGRHLSPGTRLLSSRSTVLHLDLCVVAIIKLYLVQNGAHLETAGYVAPSTNHVQLMFQRS